MVMCVRRKRHRREKGERERPGSQGPSANQKTLKHGSGVEKRGKETLVSEIHKSPFIQAGARKKLKTSHQRVGNTLSEGHH